MKKPIQLTKSIVSVRNSLHHSPCRGIVLIPLALALASLAVSPPARAVVPAPDGGYPNNNTAEGDDAPFSLTTGTDNTAIGFEALFYDTTGGDNTATGW